MGTLTAPVELTDRELQAIIALVYEKSGITLHDGKRELVAARLNKRLRQLNLPSYKAYLQLLDRDADGAELTALLDAIATNHTSFFREAQHFDLLRDQVVPAFSRKIQAAGLDGWCAASSTGQEPVTIVMTLLEAGVSNCRLLASDLSTKALATARQGVYKLEHLKGVPRDLLRKYFERGLGAQEGLGRVSRDIRQHIEYRALNLIAMDRLDRKFDFIFCRNVMIYFDKPVQQRVVSMLESHLVPGGFLFIAHSESLNGITHGMRSIAPAAFQKGGA
jgi:chemotaxis protein methyltransferase CheR